MASNTDKPKASRRKGGLENRMGKQLELSGRMRGALRAIMPAGLKITHGDGLELEPLEQNGLVAECLRDWPDDPEFVSQWDGLLARNSWGTLFRSPIWQRAVINEFVPVGRFRLILVWRGRELLAVLPLALNTVSMLETPGHWVTDFLDPLVEASCAADCWAIILDLLNKLWDWSVGGVQLHNVRADLGLGALLKELAPTHGFMYEERVIALAPYIPLPATWDEYLAGIDAHERKEIKRKLRNARTKGNLEWRTLVCVNDIHEGLDRALQAMRTAEPIKADFAEEVLIEFLKRVCPLLARKGDFVMKELWLEGKPAAWLLVMASDKGPMIYNTSYDFSARKWSPGAVSFALAIEEAIAAKHPIFNLLRGDEDYKTRFGAVNRELLRMTLRRA